MIGICVEFFKVFKVLKDSKDIKAPKSLIAERVAAAEAGGVCVRKAVEGSNSCDRCGFDYR